MSAAGMRRKSNAGSARELSAKLFRIGRREHEFDVRGRFFQSFQQRVERGRRKHMDFVNDVNFELRVGGRVFAGLAEFAHLLDAVCARAVNFQNVEAAAAFR